jgi:hypothetical protein
MTITLITRNFFKRLIGRFGGYQADGTTGNGRCKVVQNNDGSTAGLPKGTLLMRVKRSSRKWHRIGIVVREGTNYSSFSPMRWLWRAHRSKYVPHIGQRQKDRPYRPSPFARALARQRSSYTEVAHA